MIRLLRRGALAAALVSLLGGCAALSPRPDTAQVNRLLEDRGAPAVLWGATDSGPLALRERLAAPIDREAAVAIALLRSPRMAEEYARLGLARAEVIEAVEVANPGLSFSRMNLGSGPGYTQTVGLSLPFVDVLLLPLRARWARQQFERHGIDVARAVIGLTVDVEAAWYRAVAAQQVADMRGAVAEGAAASAELAQRFYDAGNISELQLKREQAVATQARIEAAHARAEALRERLAFGNLLGLAPADGAWSLADRLPMPVTREEDAESLVQLAESSNLGLRSARLQAAQLESALRTTRGTRWFGGVEAGFERERETDGTRLTGPSLSLELPLFNQGQGKLARARALLAEAQASVRQAELEVGNAVRTGARALAEHRQIVSLHRDALIPQRERIVERSQQAQNFMLIGVFELVQAKVDEYDAYQSYLEAVRDYWLARLELMRAVGQRLPNDAEPSPPTPSVQDILKPGSDEPDGEHDPHEHHQGMHGGHQARLHAEGHDSHDSHEVHKGMDHAGHDAAPPKANATPPATDHGAHGARKPLQPAPQRGQAEHAAHRGHGGGGSAPVPTRTETQTHQTQAVKQPAAASSDDVDEHGGHEPPRHDEAPHDHNDHPGSGDTP